MNDQIVPSRMNLTVFKLKTVQALKGKDLLKRKCDALKSRFRAISKMLIETKKNLGYESEAAFLMMAKSEWAAGEFK